MKRKAYLLLFAQRDEAIFIMLFRSFNTILKYNQ